MHKEIDFENEVVHALVNVGGYQQDVPKIYNALDVVSGLQHRAGAWIPATV